PSLLAFTSGILGRTSSRGSQPTYEELKLLIGFLQGNYPAMFPAYLCGIETLQPLSHIRAASAFPAYL
ncbi:MAG: hypothetical protein ACPLTR_11590, partial [Thermacetogeniaceae bacterium]